MTMMTKQQFKELMKEFPNGGIPFLDDDYADGNSVLVTDGDFGATFLVPTVDGEVFDFDWNIEEYSDDEEFYVLDYADILQIIQTLTKGLRIQLHPWWENETLD